jgi:hypothetical protein
MSFSCLAEETIGMSSGLYLPEEDSVLLVYDSVSMGNRTPVFRRAILHVSSKV